MTDLKQTLTQPTALLMNLLCLFLGSCSPKAWLRSLISPFEPWDLLTEIKQRESLLC